jgi:hypothetical protein
LDLQPDLEEKVKKICCHPGRRYSAESSSDAMTAVWQMCVSNRLSPDFVRQFLEFDKDGMAPALKRISPFAGAASKRGGPLTLPDGAILECDEWCMFLHPEKRD